MRRFLFMLLLVSWLGACGRGDAPEAGKSGPEAPPTATASGPEAPPTATASGPEAPPTATASGPEAPPTGERSPRRELAGAPAAGEEPAPPAVEAATPTRVTATVGDMNACPETPVGTVDVAFTLPPGWGEETAWGKGRWGPDGGDVAFDLGTTCSGSCHPAAVAQNMVRSFDAFRDSAARPNVNSGDPAKDAIRANVETAAEAELTYGRLLALRVTYSDEIMSSGPYRPQLRVLCAWHRPGDAWYLRASLWVDLKEGEAVLPALVEVCKSLEVKGPTASDAEKQEPLVVDGPGCALANLPEAAYTVDSTNSEGQPSVILLTRPVVVGGLPLAPIGRVYVEYNDDPISLRDVFTAEDQAFKVGDVEVTCLRRQPLRIDGACALRRCVLAQETTIGEQTAPAYSEITFETGPDGAPQIKRVVPPGT
jgi:hypothetical protein